MPSCWSTSRRAPIVLLECGAVFDVSDLYAAAGRIDLSFEGPEAALKPLLRESGGHRWQRVPPTERNGRVHSSTVTVVAQMIPPPTRHRLFDRDIAIETMRGSGAGGQHRNVTESAVRMRHLPTGIEVRICNERSQHRNRELARQILEGRVAAAADNLAAQSGALLRRQLAGSGERGDKVRTIRQRDNKVIDHRSGNSVSLDAFMSGRMPS